MCVFEERRPCVSLSRKILIRVSRKTLIRECSRACVVSLFFDVFVFYTILMIAMRFVSGSCHRHCVWIMK